MLISWIANDTLNQAKWNEIKSNDNHEIFKVPGQKENIEEANLYTSLKSICKMSEVHEIGGVWHKS